MQFNGTLKKWNAERGFGFIAATQGGPDIFVHISAFPRDGRLPAAGDELSFEIEPDRDGRKRAVRVQSQGVAAPLRANAVKPVTLSRTLAPRKSGIRGGLVTLCLVAAVGWLVYTRYASKLVHVPVAQERIPAAMAPADLPDTRTYRCDGRTHCSQMTSCNEATFFLKNCPGVSMDGNHDGVPCQQQWCTSP